jgi:hypothetical protein
MAGCYGSSAEDRHFEQMLYDHLRAEDEINEEQLAREDAEEEKADYLRDCRDNERTGNE